LNKWAKPIKDPTVTKTEQALREKKDQFDLVTTGNWLKNVGEKPSNLM
jgi:hypothetical protein